jgi:hypothetical protein
MDKIVALDLTRVKTRVCTKCKEEKPEGEFKKDMYWCKECKKEYNDKYVKSRSYAKKYKKRHG